MVTLTSHLSLDDQYTAVAVPSLSPNCLFIDLGDRRRNGQKSWSVVCHFGIMDVSAATRSVMLANLCWRRALSLTLLQWPVTPAMCTVP